MVLEVMETGEIKDKMRKLKPELQGMFMKYMREMCDQETDMMIDFISESRMEIKHTNTEMHKEQQALKDSQRSFSRATTSISLHSECETSATPGPRLDEVHNKLAVERYVRNRDRATQKRDSYQYSVSAPGTPEPPQSFEKETHEMMEDMRAVSARIENERERQAQRVRHMKEKKLAKREQRMDEAHSILQTADGADIVKQKDKQRQEQKVKELLERKKKERDTPGPRASPLPFLVTPLPDVIDDQTIVTEEKKHKKKHRSKSHDPQEGTNEPGDEHERGLRRKKKKARERERQDKKTEEEIEDDKAKKEKKKKKKKKEKSKDKESDETKKEEKKKKKKKKKDKEKEKELEPPQEADFANVAWD